MHHLDVVIAATGQKHRSGDADLMVPGRCVMRADYVCIRQHHIMNTSLTSSRLCQAYTQDGLQSFARKLQPPAEGGRSSVAMILLSPFIRTSLLSMNLHINHPWHIGSVVLFWTESRDTYKKPGASRVPSERTNDTFMNPGV